MTYPTFLVRPDGRTVTWSECGAPAGAPVLWHHGAPASRLDAAPGSPFDASSAAAGIRLIAVDRPGYGGSTPHPARNPDVVADDAAAVADALGLPAFAVLGYSAGAPMALGTARRLGERVTAVGVVAGIAPPSLADHTDLAQAARFDLARRDPAALRGELSRLAAALRADTAATAPTMLPTGALTDDDLVLASDPVYGGWLLATMAESARHDLAGWAEDIDTIRTDPATTLSGLHQHVHIVHGRHDRVVPIRHGRAVVAALDDVSFTVVEAGHLSVLNHVPALLTALATHPHPSRPAVTSRQGPRT